jgi:hypothetical protein
MTRTARPRPKPVEKILPSSVQDQLRHLLETTGSPSAELVNELHERFDLLSRHGISRRRFANYLRRLADAAGRSGAGASGVGGPEACGLKAGTPGAVGSEFGSSTNQALRAVAEEEGAVTDPAHPAPNDNDDDSDWHAKVRDLRLRQASVATILDATFGKLAQMDPDLWERRAYLMIVGMLYERLAAGEAEIPTAELVQISKALAEHRRIHARATGPAPTDDDDAEGCRSAGSSPLPKDFAEIVRQVYGTNFHPPKKEAFPIQS